MKKSFILFLIFTILSYGQNKTISSSETFSPGSTVAIQGIEDRSAAQIDKPKQITGTLPSSCTPGDLIYLNPSYNSGNTPYYTPYICKNGIYKPAEKPFNPFGGTFTHPQYVSLPAVKLSPGTTDIFTCPANKFCFIEGNSNGYNTGESETYSTGTISVTTGSATITGSGTSWTNNMVGGIINIGSLYYFIASVQNSTNLTLGITFNGTTNNSSNYQINYGSVSVTTYYKHSGIYYQLDPVYTQPPGSQVFVNGCCALPFTNMAMNAGDSISVNVNNTGWMIRGSILQVDADPNIKAIYSFGLPIGYSTLYTVPNGKGSIVGSTDLGSINTSGTIEVFISSVLSSGLMWNIEDVPAGQSPGWQYSVSNEPLMLTENAPGTSPVKGNEIITTSLGPGDSIVAYVDESPADVGKLNMVFFVKEYYIEN